MHIVMVASPWLGGSGTVGYRLARSLGNRGHQVSFVSYDSPFHASTKENGITYTNVEPYEYPLFPFPLYELSLANSIAEAVKKNNASIIHCHYGILFGHAGIIAREICKSQGIDVKCVVTAHGSDVFGFDLAHPGTVVPTHLNTWLFSVADVVTTVSGNLREGIKSLYGVTRDISVIHNSIQTSDFNPATPWMGGTIRLLHVSNFRAVKRPLLALEVIKNLRERGVDVELVFIGDGPERSRTIERASMDKLNSSVHFLGLKNETEVRNELNKAHALLLTSDYESFPLSALEAHAAGLPVISSDVGGVSEIIANGVSGELVKNHGRASKYSDAVATIFASPETWLQYAHDARKHAKNFDDERIVPQYEKLYEELKA